jgi:hypothetical protein
MLDTSISSFTFFENVSPCISMNSEKKKAAAVAAMAAS